MALGFGSPAQVAYSALLQLSVLFSSARMPAASPSGSQSFSLMTQTLMQGTMAASSAKTLPPVK